MIRLRRPVDERVERQMPTVALAVGRAVRSGSTLAEAIAEAGLAAAVPGSSLAEDLAGIGRAVRRGASLDTALDEWGRSSADGSVALFVAACRFGHAHGGDLAAALEGAAVSLLDRVETADEARALATQARSSAAVVAALPLVGVTGFVVLDPEVGRTLVGTAAGRACLVAGIALDVVGTWVLGRMIRRALR